MLTPSLKTVFFISSLVFFPSCQSLQKGSFPKPSLPMIENWEDAEQRFFKNQPIPSEGTQLFHSSQWEKMIAQALAKNPDLQRQAHLVKQAKQRFLVQKANQLPSVHGNTSLQYQDNKILGGNFNSREYQLGIQADWEVDYLKKNQNQSTQHFFDFKASLCDYYDARLNLIAQIARTWVTAIEAKKQIESTERNIQNYKNNQATIEESFKAGTKSALDLQLIKVDRALAESQIEVQKNRFNESLRSLNQFHGKYPSTEYPSLPNELPSLITPIPVGIPSDIMKRRPDIIAEEYRIQSHFLGTEVARKKRFPKISLTTSGGTQSVELKNILSRSHSFWNLATNLVQPIFDGGRLKAEWEAEKSSLEAQLAQYQTTVIQALKEVENALGNEHNLRKQLEKIQEAETQSKKAERSAWDNYQKGLVKIDTALSTQRRTISTQTQKYALQGKILHNRIDLFLALGGDWSNPLGNNNQP